MAERTQIIRALCGVEGIGPEQVKAVGVDEGAARVTLALDGPPERRDATRRAAVEAVRSVEGVEDVEVSLVAGEAAARTGDRPAAEGTAPEGAAPAPRTPPSGPIELSGVGDVLAVGAGKGGVGKSTVAVHLAVGLARRGARVGLLDADIYGPSIASMTGIAGLQPSPSPDGRVAPFEAMGLRVVSIANFVEPGAALIWRGPMVHGAVRQLLGEVDWGSLDYLIVDLPPGTGDVPLTLAQAVGVTGAVVVSTPQEVALQDALRAAAMYEKLGVAVLGLVENMSYFVCPDCQAEHDLFGRGGTRRAAEQRGLPCLGEVPLHGSIRAQTDAARAEANFEESAPAGRAMSEMVDAVAAAVRRRRESGPAPTPLAAPKA